MNLWPYQNVRLLPVRACVRARMNDSHDFFPHHGWLMSMGPLQNDYRKSLKLNEIISAGAHLTFLASLAAFFSGMLKDIIDCFSLTLPTQSIWVTNNLSLPLLFIWVLASCVAAVEWRRNEREEIPVDLVSGPGDRQQRKCWEVFSSQHACTAAVGPKRT